MYSLKNFWIVLSSVVYLSQIYSRMKRSARSLDADNTKAEDNVDAEDNKKRKKVRFEKSLDNKSTGKNKKNNEVWI